MVRFAIALGALFLSVPLAAEVRDVSSSGFVSRNGVDVPASPDAAWAMLVTPRKWWNAEHSYSQDAANLSLDPRAGGCFCEILPNPASPKAAPRGSAEHMRVIYVEQPRALRMSGALGPLQAGAGTGTLTVILKPLGEGEGPGKGGGTRILWEYTYGGYVRGDVPELAKAVDAVLAGQLLGLARSLGARGAATAPVSIRDREPTARPVPTTKQGSSDDFLREMQAGIADGGQAAPVNAPESVKLGNTAPEKTVNDQGFIGR